MQDIHRSWQIETRLTKCNSVHWGMKQLLYNYCIIVGKCFMSHMKGFTETTQTLSPYLHNSLGKLE